MINDERLAHIQAVLEAAKLKISCFTLNPTLAVRKSLEDVRLANAMLQELDNILSGIVPPEKGR
jgi:hypothetical protein